MAAISGLGSTNAAGASSMNAFSEMKSEDFIKIMFTELSRQDPTKPSDTNTLLQQLSNLRSIQSSVDLSGKLESLVSQNQLASAGNLIGKLISGLDERNVRVEGVVAVVNKTADGPVVQLTTGERVPFGQIDAMAGIASERDS